MDTAPDTEAWDGLTAEEIARQTEAEALDRVEAREGVIRDVEAEQAKIVREAYAAMNAKGGDGASVMGDLPGEEPAPTAEQVPAPTAEDAPPAEGEDAGMVDAVPEEEEVLQAVRSDGEERASRFTDDLHIADIESDGLEDDATRKRFIRKEHASVGADEEVGTEIDRHELRHARQAAAVKDSVQIETGDAEVDAMLELGSEEYRERDAMEFAGHANTAQEYHEDYLEPVNRVADYLESNGEQGEKLVEDAAMKGDVDAVRAAVARAHFRARMEKREPAGRLN